MKHRFYKTEPVKENPHKVDVRQMYDDESAQIMHVTLESGESLKPHKTPVDVCFYILEGIATVHIGDTKEIFAKDTLIESPANIVHYLSNEGDVKTRILVIKAPRPIKQTKLL